MRSLPILLALAVCTGAATAHDPVTPKPKLLQKGIPLRQLTGIPGASQVYHVIIPADVEKLTFRSSGGKGDCDLYVRQAVHPTSSDFDFSSEAPQTVEKVVVRNPAPGRWYVLVEAASPFHGVQLTAHYALKKRAVRAPTMLPGPGVFDGTATVRLKCSTDGATVRFTTDGTAVTSESAVYKSPVILQADTRLRAKAFGRRRAESVEAEGDYIVRPKGTVTPLVSGHAIFHRAGHTGSEHLFKITVPAGEKVLRLRSEGGPGDTELLVRHGAPPAKGLYGKRVNGRRNEAFCEFTFPVAGDWFVSVRGLSDFSGVSLLALSRPDQPDLIVWRDALQPYIEEAEYTAEDCEVQEGTIEAGQHTLLRFDTHTRNIGGADLVMPSPEGNPDFEYQACHDHYHYKGFAAYRLLDAQEQPVVTGRKVSFCLLDVSRWDRDATKLPHYTCDEQGIQAGWADIYDAGLPGQWIDVTGVPDGVYTLEITLNPEAKLLEADYTNNTERVSIELGTDGTGARTVQLRS